MFYYKSKFIFKASLKTESINHVLNFSFATIPHKQRSLHGQKH